MNEHIEKCLQRYKIVASEKCGFRVHGGTLNGLRRRCVALGDRIHWEALSKADSFNLFHDMNGIRLYYDMDSGEFKNWFLPRYSLTTKENKNA